MIHAIYLTPEIQNREMNMSSNRREFLKLSCSCLGLMAAADLKALAGQSAPAGGSMTGWTAQHLTQGYWSADSLLLSALKYMNKPEEIVSAATGFGGGIGRKDLCGYVTGGVMAIGLFCNAAKGSDKAGRQKCQRLTKEYVDWWTSTTPIHCGEIKQPCDYKAMGEKASDFLQKLFEREGQKA
jgi:C_GCAxxG_C_C family probable redox protein